jgi:hypothetical protein
VKTAQNTYYESTHKDSNRNFYRLEATHACGDDNLDGDWIWRVRIYRNDTSSLLYDEHHTGQGDAPPIPSVLLAAYAAWASTLAVEWASCVRSGIKPLGDS